MQRDRVLGLNHTNLKGNTFPRPETRALIVLVVEPLGVGNLGLQGGFHKQGAPRQTQLYYHPPCRDSSQEGPLVDPWVRTWKYEAQWPILIYYVSHKEPFGWTLQALPARRHRGVQRVYQLPRQAARLGALETGPGMLGSKSASIQGP